MTAAHLLNGSSLCTLRVRLDPTLDGLHVSNRVLATGMLTTVHETTIEEDLRESMLGSPLLTRQNPLLPDSASQYLDSAGLIRPGTCLEEDAVLASVVRFAPTDKDDPAPPAPGMGRVSDLSVHSPHGWAGAIVEEAAYCTRREMGSEAPAGCVGRVRVKLRLVIPLSVGDVLLLGQTQATIAGVIDSPEADLFVGVSLARSLSVPVGRSVSSPVAVAVEPARWSLVARATGPYSLITNQPLGGRWCTPGQKMRPSFIHTLRWVGLVANLTEMVTLKSDDVGNRPALQAALNGQGPFPQPGAPETLNVLLDELAGLGFGPTLSSVGDHTELALAPMTDADRMALSRGQVKKPDTINYRTYKPEPGGIMCEAIFGAEGHPDRRTRFGHIVLTDPIVPYFYRMPPKHGEASLLAGLLGLTDAEIAGLLSQQLRLEEDGSLAACDNSRSSFCTGAFAIEQLLSRLPDDALPAGLRGRADARSALVVRTILVIPPDLRPLVLLDSGNFATSDLNDLYRRVINRANRLRKLLELNAPATIIYNERRMLQKALDNLFANGLLPRTDRVLGTQNRPLKDLLDMATWRIGWRDPKRADYSARARLVSSSLLSADTALVPRSIAATLDLPENGPVLFTRDVVPSEHATPVAVLRAKRHDFPVIAMHPTHVEAICRGVDGVPACVIHRPLSPAAIAEADRFVGKVVSAPHAAGKTWMDLSDPRAIAAHLLDAAMQGRPLSFDSPAGELLAGPGIIAFSPVDADRVREDPVAEMPLPLRGPDIRSRMRDLAMSLRCKALVFRWGRLDRLPRAQDGTIGLSPWLPDPFRWPRNDKPLSFVAQLPLDPARQAGVLPGGAFADVPAGSLLTVFWDQATRGVVAADPDLLQFVPIGPDLTRHAYPADQPPEANGLVLVSEVVEEAPGWRELREMFRCEFGDIDPADLAQFEIEELRSLPPASADTKFGGWASWAQTPALTSPLLFQVASDIKVSELTFGDSGALYATLRHNGVELMTQ